MNERERWRWMLDAGRRNASRGWEVNESARAEARLRRGFSLGKERRRKGIIINNSSTKAYQQCHAEIAIH
jgi:hypothetical protein